MCGWLFNLMLYWRFVLPCTDCTAVVTIASTRYLPENTSRTQNTKAPWLSQKPEVDARVRLYPCCCTAMVLLLCYCCRTAVVSLLSWLHGRVWKSEELLFVYRPASAIARVLRVCVRYQFPRTTGIMAQTHPQKRACQ